MTNIEKAQIYFSIGLFILGYRLDITQLIMASAGIFLGSGLFLFFKKE
jgi:glycopeptide antibiotics resistance protein